MSYILIANIRIFFNTIWALKKTQVANNTGSSCNAPYPPALSVADHIPN